MSERDNELTNKLITFSRSVTPEPIERRLSISDDKWILWGENNLYPNFLLELFGRVPLHQSISTTKVDFLIGDGIQVKGTGEKAEFEVSSYDSLEDITQKIVFDFVLFNFFALEVQYDVLTHKPLYFNHIPAHKIRMNKSKTKYWVSDDWELKREVLSYDRWIKGKNGDGLSKIFLYSGYVPSIANTYPTVKYKAAITSMVTAMLVNDLNKTNVEDGFSPAHIINFFKGVPTSEDARSFERKFAETYKGADGLKYLLTYNNADDKAVEISTIEGDDYAEKLVEVIKQNESDILHAHQATRLLFGVETEGSLGGNGAELEIQYEQFKNLWVKNNRNIVESGLNRLFEDAGLPLIEFKDKNSLFSSNLPDTTKEKVYTINELREIDGLPPIANGDVLMQEVAKGSAKDGEPVPTGENITPEGIIATGGTVSSGSTLITSKKLSADDFESIRHLGYSKGDFSLLDSYSFYIQTDEDFKKVELIFDDAKDIENYLLTHKISGKSLSDIKADIRKDLAIGVSTKDLAAKINALTDAGVLNSKIVGDNVSITPVKQDVPRTVETMYDYQVRPGYGDPLIATSRDFCTRLIDNDRLYTRADIQTMGEIFGYDVFTHCGGWYTDPNTGNAQNQCRHQWVSQRVIRKVNK